MTRFIIEDKANGIVQFDDVAESADDAWAKFMAILGYDEEIPGVCTRDAYIISEA